MEIHPLKLWLIKHKTTLRKFAIITGIPYHSLSHIVNYDMKGIPKRGLMMQVIHDITGISKTKFFAIPERYLKNWIHYNKKTKKVE